MDKQAKSVSVKKAICRAQFEQHCIDAVPPRLVLDARCNLVQLASAMSIYASCAERMADAADDTAEVMMNEQQHAERLARIARIAAGFGALYAMHLMVDGDAPRSDLCRRYLAVLTLRVHRCRLSHAGLLRLYCRLWKIRRTWQADVSELIDFLEAGYAGVAQGIRSRPSSDATWGAAMLSKQ